MNCAASAGRWTNAPRRNPHQQPRRTRPRSSNPQPVAVRRRLPADSRELRTMRGARVRSVRVDRKCLPVLRAGPVLLPIGVRNMTLAQQLAVSLASDADKRRVQISRKHFGELFHENDEPPQSKAARHDAMLRCGVYNATTETRGNVYELTFRMSDESPANVARFLRWMANRLAGPSNH